MAETDEAFILRVNDQFKKASSKVNEISSWIKGKNKDGQPIVSPLFNAIYNIEKDSKFIEEELAKLNILKYKISLLVRIQEVNLNNI